MSVELTILESVKTGFINQLLTSDKSYRPELITNNAEEGKKVLTTILRELENCDEFWFSVAFITTGGIASIINTLIELEKSNVKGKILASQYLNFTHPEALRRIKRFNNIELRIATEGDFHSKGYLFRKNNVFSLIVGSSNLTQSALSSNRELNLKVSAFGNSELIEKTKLEFQQQFHLSEEVTESYIDYYEKLYLSIKENNELLKKITPSSKGQKITPNLMQEEALKNIKKLRKQGKNKALLISATGTGKTYLTAFDVQRLKPKTFLFVVHRRTVAKEALKTFQSLLGTEIKMGLYSGSHQDINAQYLFSTVQTISKREHLNRFSQEHFDYIVIDETHRAGASSYERIIEYFRPKFLLGMTATPERTDGADIFSLFDHNIAYEIRLHRALSEGMLSPFHYYGVTDLTINDQVVDDKTEFNLLTSDERISRVIDKIQLFGCDDGNPRGLIFCSRKEECRLLSLGFNQRGYKTIALTGDSAEEERGNAIDLLESDSVTEKLDYIFTVDIFNEGVDIPRVNQIIMLRPTQSAIIFVQQLGRGLRKIDNKEYLTVIDFIGNYSNNYLVPIALYGDSSYNKDTIRKIISSGSRLIPGASTINFDRITKERIFESIDSSNLQTKKDLLKDYNLLKYKIGTTPMMVDFLDHGSRDPVLFVNYSKSYFNFVADREEEYNGQLNPKEKKLLELFSNEINNAKRIEETQILKLLIKHLEVDIEQLKQKIKEKYHFIPSDHTIESCIRNLNFLFVTENKNKKLRPVGEIYDIKVVTKESNKIKIHPEFQEYLANPIFKSFLNDNVEYSKRKYSEDYHRNNYHQGFNLYRKYSRKDVFRILNWEQNPLAQNVGGYMVSPDGSNCPIFVNYHKDEDISATTKYEDRFLNPNEFLWMSKSRRTLKSNDVLAIRNTEIRLPLFIKKSNDEGTEFYYMGDLAPIDESFEETKMEDDNGKFVSVVKILFKMKAPVDTEIYEYITANS